MFGRRATRGHGPEEYSVRLPLFIAENTHINEEDREVLDGIADFAIGDRAGYFEKREFYRILCVKGFLTIDSAKEFLDRLAVAIARVSIAGRIAIRFEPFPEEIDRGSSNQFFRENLMDQLYGDWAIIDGRRTDGGVFPHLTYILPEHERLWEYPMFWGKAARPLRLTEVRNEFASAGQYRSAERVFEDEAFLPAMEAIWMAHEQRDHRLKFILLVTALEILSQGEEPSRIPPEVLNTISEIKQIIGTRSISGLKGDYDRLLRLADQMRDKGLTDKIRELMFRKAGDLFSGGRVESDKTVSDVYRFRSKLTHGGKIRSSTEFREQLVNRLERLQELVGTIMIRKIDEIGGQASAL